MTDPKHTQLDRLMQALEAIDSLARQDLDTVFSEGLTVGLMAHSEIENRPVKTKSAAFYKYFGPLHDRLVQVLTEIYRRCFKLALANPRETGPDPNEWAWAQLQLAVVAVLEWIRDWHILACDGENKYIRPVGSAPAVPGETVSFSVPLSVPALRPPEAWRAPAWLFLVSPYGIAWLKSEHIPATDTEQKLGAAHTRLLLKASKRVFLRTLAIAIERVRNEETAATGAIPAGTLGEQARGERKGSKRRLRGFQGLGPKTADYSQYMQNLTEKQHMAMSLKLEYELGLAEIASRMGIDRKTAHEHIAAATRKIDHTISGQKRKARRAKGTPE